MSDIIVARYIQEDLGCELREGQRKQGRIFAHNPDGRKLVLSLLQATGGKQAHGCMEAIGSHSLGVALALHDAGHVVSVVNPAQIQDFARSKLGRNKTDKIDATLIRNMSSYSNRDHGCRRRRRCGGSANCRPFAPATSVTGRTGRTYRQRPRRWHRDQPGRRDDRAFHHPARGDRQGHRQNDRPGRRIVRQTRPVAQHGRCRRNADRLAVDGYAGAGGSVSEWRDGRLCGDQPEPPPVRYLN